MSPGAGRITVIARKRLAVRQEGSCPRRRRARTRRPPATASRKRRARPRCGRGARTSACAPAASSRERIAFRTRSCSPERQLSVPGAPNMPMMSEVRVTSSRTMRSSTRLPAISASMTWKCPDSRIACRRSWWSWASASACRCSSSRRQIRLRRPRDGAAHDARLDGAPRVEDVARLLGRRPRHEGAPVDVKLHDLAAREHQEAAADVGPADAERLAERRSRTASSPAAGAVRSPRHGCAGRSRPRRHDPGAPRHFRLSSSVMFMQCSALCRIYGHSLTCASLNASDRTPAAKELLTIRGKPRPLRVIRFE